MSQPQRRRQTAPALALLVATLALCSNGCATTTMLDSGRHDTAGTLRALVLSPFTVPFDLITFPIQLPIYIWGISKLGGLGRHN